MKIVIFLVLTILITSLGSCMSAEEKKEKEQLAKDEKKEYQRLFPCFWRLIE